MLAHSVCVYIYTDELKKKLNYLVSLLNPIENVHDRRDYNTMHRVQIDFKYIYIYLSYVLFFSLFISKYYYLYSSCWMGHFSFFLYSSSPSSWNVYMYSWAVNIYIYIWNEDETFIFRKKNTLLSCLKCLYRLLLFIHLL